MSAVILVAYITEVLYYFSNSMADWEYEAPQPAAIRCLGSVLVWGPFLYTLWTSKSLRWHPYFGAFVLQFAFESTTCLMGAFSAPTKAASTTSLPTLEAIRALASLLLMLDGFAILITKHIEKEASTDEERQSLLKTPANGAPSGAAGQNGSTDYGSIPQESAGEDDADSTDHDKEIKDKQAQRLEEEGGWLGYLKGFGVFAPYLFPRNDWRVMGCLALRLVHMLSSRVLNLLTPRQLGIITNKLQKQDGVMPWTDIYLWVLYQYLDSYAGLGIFDSLASIYISTTAYQRVTLLAYKHVLGLSMDFHTSKDSGEVLKAVEQASSLNSLVEMLIFDISPIFLDLVVAMYYVTHLFDAYMAFIILFMGAAYICIGFYFTALSQPKRRDYVEKQRTESTTVNETVHNWQTVAYFNRLVFEHSRYATNIMTTIKAQYIYYFRSLGGHAAQDVLTTFGFAGACIFGMTQIVSGRKPVGNLITLIM